MSNDKIQMTNKNLSQRLIRLWRKSPNEIPIFIGMTKGEEMKRQGESGLEGQRAISAAEMSEEPDNNIMHDEFLREEIGCCPEKENNSLEKRDPLAC